MSEANMFLEYLSLQSKTELITKSELIQFAREKGAPISDRQLTTYVSEGLIPKSARIGSRSGAYPQIVGALLVWIIGCRKRGVSIDAIKELLPLWRYLQAQVKDLHLDLAAFEEIARETVHLSEAVFEVPYLLDSCLVCSGCGHPLDIKVVTKDGETHLHDRNHPFTLGFVVAEQDEVGNPRVLASTSRVLPVRNLGTEFSTVILGIPNGVDLPELGPDCDGKGISSKEEVEAKPKGGARERRRA